MELDDEAQVVVQVGRALDRAWAGEPGRCGGRERVAECVGSSGRAGRAEGGRLAARVRGQGQEERGRLAARGCCRRSSRLGVAPGFSSPGRSTEPMKPSG